MNDLNSIYLVGRLIADPKVKATESSYVAKFTLANNSYRYDEIKKEYEQKTSFFDIVVFGKENENAVKKLKKGVRVGVNGHLAMTEKIDKDGEKKKGIQIACYTIKILDPSIYKDGKNKNLTEEVNDGKKEEDESV